jgi:hypothetical protein
VESLRAFYKKRLAPLKRLRLFDKYQLLFTAVVALSTIVAMCSTVVGVLQLRESHRYLVVSQRPWIGISAPIDLSSLSLDPKDAKASYTIHTKNFGASVATHVSLSTRPVVRADQIFPNKELTCKEALSFMNASTFVAGRGVVEKGGGGVVFPSEEGTSQFLNLRIERPDIDPSQLLFIVGCIQYDDEFGEPHQTQFLYWSGTDATSLKVPFKLLPFITSNIPQ